MSPCDWDVDPATLGMCPDWTTYSADVRAAALHQATLFLWAATGRRFGPCPLTVRPSQGDCVDPVYQTYPVTPGQDPPVSGPYLYNGQWHNRGCRSACCGVQCSVVLRGPVHSITEVLVSGVIVPSDAYRVDITQGAYRLIRLDGTCWPTCQNSQAGELEDGAFVIDYEIGLPLPVSLEIATAILACEYAKDLVGGVCNFPAKMTRLSRQGVEVEVEQPAPDDDSRTGIPAVDRVIASLNPSKRKAPVTVMSPDLEETCDRFTVIHPGAS